MSIASLPPGYRDVPINQSSLTGGDLSFPLPATLMPGDKILCLYMATGTVTQTAGVTMSQVPGLAISQGGRVSVISYADARAPAVAAGGISQDAGTTLTMHTTAGVPWCGQMHIIKRGYAVSLTAFGDNAKQGSGTGQTQLALTGAVAGAANTATISWFAFVTDANNITNTFPSTVAVTGGPDPLYSAVTTAATSGQKGVGIAMYTATAPTQTANGATAATRTITFPAGAASTIHGYSLCIRPMMGLQNDVIYGEWYKTAIDDPILQVFHAFYPTVSYSTPRKVVIWLHGGVIGSSAYLNLTKYRLSDEYLAQGAVIVTPQWRQPVPLVRGGDEGMWDLHHLWRFLITNAAVYNFDPTQIFVIGNSAGGVAALLLTETMNNTAFYGPSPENAGTVEVCVRRMVCFPGSNNRFDDGQKARLGIANPPPVKCNSLSTAYSTDGNPSFSSICTLDAWDQATYPIGGGAVDTSFTARANLNDPAFWAKHGSVVIPTRIIHGTADTTVSYPSSDWNGSLGFPPGLYQAYLASGRLPVFFNPNVGAQHGLDGQKWQPLGGEAPTQGAWINSLVTWHLTGAAVAGDPVLTSTLALATVSPVMSAVIPANPVTVTVAITNTGLAALDGPVIGAKTYSVNSGAIQWLVAHGMNPVVVGQSYTMSLIGETSPLSPGTYTVSFPVSDASAVNSPVIVTLTFTVSPDPSKVGSVWTIVGRAYSPLGDYTETELDVTVGDGTLPTAGLSNFWANPTVTGSFMARWVRIMFDVSPEIAASPTSYIVRMAANGQDFIPYSAAYHPMAGYDFDHLSAPWDPDLDPSVIPETRTYFYTIYLYTTSGTLLSIYNLTYTGPFMPADGYIDPPPATFPPAPALTLGLSPYQYVGVLIAGADARYDMELEILMGSTISLQNIHWSSVVLTAGDNDHQFDNLPATFFYRVRARYLQGGTVSAWSSNSNVVQVMPGGLNP